MLDGGVQQYLPPSTNQSLGIEAGACVKVIATSRRTRKNWSKCGLLFLNVFFFRFLSIFSSEFYLVQVVASSRCTRQNWSKCHICFYVFVFRFLSVFSSEFYLVKVVATSRCTRQNWSQSHICFMYLYWCKLKKLLSIKKSRKNMVIRSCVAPGVPAQCGTFRFSQVVSIYFLDLSINFRSTFPYISYVNGHFWNLPEQ